jgi:5-methylcytosine-specific restriction endonuclease McrA
MAGAVVPRKKPSRDERRRVQERAARRCEYCHAPQEATGARFHIEHIHPLAAGGGDDFDNLAFSCPSCNLAKNRRTTAVDPVTKQVVPLFNPRTDVWDDHFAWAENRRTMIGKTPTGRATVVALDCNNPDLWPQARALWFDNGLLP